MRLFQDVVGAVDVDDDDPEAYQTTLRKEGDDVALLQARRSDAYLGQYDGTH